MQFLGIDIGSTFLKCGLLSPQTHTVTQVRIVSSPGSLPADHPRHFVCDARQYVRLVTRLIEETVRACQQDISVILSTQMHGFVAEDRYISWQDSRCLEDMEDGVSYLGYMKSRVPPEEMRRCGVYCKPSLGVCNLFAKLHQEGRLDADLEIFTLGSYILHQLTGRNCCHITNAAPLGFADVEKKQWDLPLFQRFGLSGLRLPQIVQEDYAPCGQFTVGGHTVTFYPDYGDQQASLLGSGADGSAAVINIATASQLITFSPTPDYGSYEVRPYWDGGYIKVLSNMPGGRALQVLTGLIRDVGRSIYHQDMDDAGVFAGIAALPPVPPQRLTVDLSFYPTYDRFDGGSISHIDPENLTVGTLFAAAYESMAESYRAGFERLLRRRPERVVCMGGAVRKNTRLRESIEAALECPCCLPESEDEVLMGLLHIAERIHAEQQTGGTV